MEEKCYLAIDLKSFYASVECVERGLDPLTTHLVVADATRTEKTICLAVSPALRAYGVPSRPRLFEVVQKVKEFNYQRKKRAKVEFTQKSYDDTILRNDNSVALDYLVVPPRMAFYMKYSTDIYQVYLKYVAPEDIHVYSIDEVFIDATNYLKLYRLSAREFTFKLIKEVLEKTGITATAGIGTNLYLCKVAMDIVAKRIPADKNGVRIAELDEMSYRKTLWSHKPITDFWRVGSGYAKKLEQFGIYTMGDIARCSLGKAGTYYNEDLLYEAFGINAELLIDHAWGYEPCTIADIKNYRPQSKSISIGQVLPCAYEREKGALIAREMAEQLAYDLTRKGLVCNQIVLTVGYDIENAHYTGELTTDRYGRKMPKQAHGSENLGRYTASATMIRHATDTLYDRIVEKGLFVRRMYLVANHVFLEGDEEAQTRQQLDLFTDYEELKREELRLEREKRGQKAVVSIKEKYGKNAILKGMDIEEGATAKSRNDTLGGHKA